MAIILQYFVFDESGNDILEAGGIPCDNEQELHEISNEIIEQVVKKDGLGLILNDNTNGKVLYNSKEEK